MYISSLEYTGEESVQQDTELKPTQQSLAKAQEALVRKEEEDEGRVVPIVQSVGEEKYTIQYRVGQGVFDQFRF